MGSYLRTTLRHAYVLHCFFVSFNTNPDKAFLLCFFSSLYHAAPRPRVGAAETALAAARPPFVSLLYM